MNVKLLPSNRNTINHYLTPLTPSFQITSIFEDFKYLSFQISRRSSFKIFVNPKMGITVSSNPSCPRYVDFVQLVSNSKNYIEGDRIIWTPFERQTLIQFFNGLQECLVNPNNPCTPWGLQSQWPTDPRIEEYFYRVRAAIPKTFRTQEVFAFADDYSTNPRSGGIVGFHEDFSNANPRTQVQYAHIFAIVGFMWTSYDGDLVKYFYQSDVLTYLCQQENYQASFMSAIEKIYFTRKDSVIPAKCLIIPTTPFCIRNGIVKSFSGERVPNDRLITDNCLYYTTTTTKLDTLLNIPIDVSKVKIIDSRRRYDDHSDAIDIEDDGDGEKCGSCAIPEKSIDKKKCHHRKHFSQKPQRHISEYLQEILSGVNWLCQSHKKML